MSNIVKIIEGLKILYEIVKAVFKLLDQLRRLTNEKDEKKAEERRQSINIHIDRLQQAKTPEERKKAIIGIANNSF